MSIVSVSRTQKTCKTWASLYEEISWSNYANKRLNKTIMVCSLRRNIAYKVETNIKLGLYKSVVLPIVTYALLCAKLSEGTMNALDRLKKKAVKWIMNKQTSYVNSLRLLNILPLPMFVQMNHLLFSSVTEGNLPRISNIHTKMACSARRLLNYQIKIPRTERRRSEFFFRKCQIVNKANNCFGIGKELLSKTSLRNVDALL